ncbi:cellulose binding domain-containing protein, partial [Streptomyces sp. F8]
MGSTVGHRRRTSRKARVTGAIVAAAVIGGAAFALTGTAHAGSVGAVYTKSSSWSGGYTGQYVITNSTGQAQSGWTLEFDLPAGTRIDSLWNGTHTVAGQRVTVKPASWNGQLAAGASVTVGFVASGAGAPGDPTGCRINGLKCSVDQGATAQPSGRPTTRPTAT